MDRTQTRCQTQPGKPQITHSLCSLCLWTPLRNAWGLVFFSQAQKQNLSWPLHVETSGQQKKSKQFRLEALSKMGKFCLPSGNFFNKSKPIKSLGKYSPENAACAVLPPYLHVFPFLPRSCLGDNGSYPHRSGRALQEHLLCWLREELILCKFSSGFFTHHFTTPYPYLHTKEKLEKFHGSWLQWYFVRQAQKEPGHTFNI